MRLHAVGWEGGGSGGVKGSVGVVAQIPADAATCRKRISHPMWNEGLLRTTAKKANEVASDLLYGYVCCSYMHAISHTHKHTHACSAGACSECVLLEAMGLTAHTMVHHALYTRSRQTDREAVAGTETHAVRRHRRHLLVTGT